MTIGDIKILGEQYDNGKISLSEYLDACGLSFFPKEITDNLFIKPSASWLLMYKVQLEFEAESKEFPDIQPIFF